ncbi:MAG: enoyl-CoA hydratase/isomerase family protein [Ilumatobacteraceae bacterium]
MDTLTTRLDDGVLVVTLDRPEALNAFSMQMMDELCETFLAAAADPSVRVLVLTGSGRAFCAGADLKEMGTGVVSRHGLDGFMDSIIDFPKPYLLAVNGLGVGIGCTLVGVADLAFIADGARLRCPFTSLGLSAEAASTYTFPLLMGHQRAFWMLQSSEWFSAEQVVAAGLAFEVCAPEHLMTRTMEHARTLAALPTDSLAANKRLLMGARREGLRDAVRRENEQLAVLAGGPANREALRAFAERRPPDFTSGR